MILDVPYQSQIPYETNEEVHWCGIVSLWMVMSYYLKDKAPTIQNILDKYGQEYKNNGHQHKDLLKIARDYNLRGFRKSWWAEPGVQPLLEKFQTEGETQEDIDDWLEINLAESFTTLKSLIEQNIPVILSVNQDFSPSQSTHLVVLAGYEDNILTLHDPYKKGSNFKISEQEFRKCWLRQAIIIKG